MDKDKLVSLGLDLGLVRRDVAIKFVDKVYEEAKKDYSFDHAHLWLKRIENALERERIDCANLLLHTNLSGLKNCEELQFFIANLLNECAKSIMARKTTGEIYD